MPQIKPSFSPLTAAQFDELTKEAIPIAVRDLLPILDYMFPERCIGESESERSAVYRSGARYVVNMLLNWQHETDEVPDDTTAEFGDDGMPKLLA